MNFAINISIMEGKRHSPDESNPGAAKLIRTDTTVPYLDVPDTDPADVKKMRYFGMKPKISVEPKPELKGFHADILDAYGKWMHAEHGISVTLDDKMVKFELGAILNGQADVMVHSKSIGNWPLMIRTVYQSPNSIPRPVAEILQGRENSYLQHNNEKDIWEVKKGSNVWYACQNVLALYNLPVMYLLIYNPRNMDFLVVEVVLDKSAYLDDLHTLYAFLKDNVNTAN